MRGGAEMKVNDVSPEGGHLGRPGWVERSIVSLACHERSVAQTMAHVEDTKEWRE